MKLYEYMAKGLLKDAGVPVAQGVLCRTPGEARAAAASIGPVAVKAQVLVGGRGKAGGILLARTPDEADAAAGRILGMDLKGYRVETVWCEQALQIERELYVSIAVDPALKRPILIASAQGGVDIEEVPEKAILRQPVPIEWGLQPFMGREMARRLGLGDALAPQFTDIVLKLYSLFRRYDAELVECNPLAVVAGRLVAADARLNIDDDAVSRHPDLPQVSEATPLEAQVRALGLAFVQLEGDIGVLANGAGINMATLDVLQHFGGRPMNFLDAGGGAEAGPTAEALRIVLSTNPKAVLINIFGGITRCDEVAKAILDVRQALGGIPVPLVVRLVGTNEARAVEMLQGAGISAFRSMSEAARRVVELAGEGVAP